MERLGRTVIGAGAALALGTEILSLFHLFSFAPVLVLWSMTGLGSAFAMRAARKQQGHDSRVDRLPWQRDELFLVGLTGVLVTCALVSGLLCPPNSWDSMVSHMPRQVRWIQQGSLEHFPAHVIQQLVRGPYAETLQASLQLLTRTDLTTQCVSWMALLGCALYVALNAAELGASRRAQLLGCVAAVSVPIAFLEASTTKNDVMVAMWALAAVWLTIRAFRSRVMSRGDALLLGLALGLGGLTKATFYLMMCPFVPVIGVMLLRLRLRLRERWKYGILIAAAFLLVNLGHWTRNVLAFEGPLGPDDAMSLQYNKARSMPRFLSRVVREASLELATPFDASNRRVESAVLRIHQWLGLDVLDPATTYPNRPFQVLFLPHNEYQAAAPVHFILFLFLPLAGLLVRRRLAPCWWIVAGVPWAIFLWICLVSNWEPFLNPRLHLLPFFLTAGALAAWVDTLERQPGKAPRSGARRTVAATTLGALLFALGVLPSVVESDRSVTGSVFRPRAELLFDEGRHLRPIYEQAAALVRSFHPGVIGLDCRGDWAWEYPVMRLLRRDPYEPTFVSVNPTLVADRSYPTPDVLIVFRSLERYTDRRHERTYRAAGHFGFITVLR